jgi:hypothetical protein
MRARTRKHIFSVWDGTFSLHVGFRAGTARTKMGRYLLLWLLGVPIPLLILIWLLGGMH